MQKSPQPNGQALALLQDVLARAYREEGKTNESARMKGDVIESLQPGANPHVDPAVVAMQQAGHHRAQGDLVAAETSYREAISILEKARTDNTRGPGYPWILPAVLEGLGELYVAEKRDFEAEGLFKRAFDLCEQYASPSRQGVSFARNMRFPLHLYNLYQREGRLDEMEPVFERALTVEEKVLGPQDPAVGETSFHFAQLYHEEGKNQEAVPLLQRAIEIQEKNGNEPLQLAMTLDQYAVVLEALGEENQAAAARSRAELIRSGNAAENQRP
jgi:tetratricopeptide (TPR) repeat protein